MISRLTLLFLLLSVGVGIAGASTLKINFQSNGAPIPAGYFPDYGAAFGDRGNGWSYGWDVDNTANTRDRNNIGAPDQRYDTVNHFRLVNVDLVDRVWEIALPNGTYTRVLTDQFTGFLKDKKYLIHDRDPLFTQEFRAILKSSGVKPIRTLPMSPHLNCVVERFVRSIKSEALDRMLIFGERHLEYVIKEYMEHYHTERPHQGIGNEIIEPPPQGEGKIVCQERLGGLLKSYRRAA